jgi:hypothetical protein
VSNRAFSVTGIVSSVALASLSVLLLAGCPPGPTYVVQEYQGPPRSLETIGVLRVNGKDSVRLETLDDQEITARVDEDARLHVELLPGRHTLSVRSGEPGRRVAFDAQPGKVYRVVMEDAAPHVHEVDRETDSVGRDVTARTDSQSVSERE